MAKRSVLVNVFQPWAHPRVQHRAYYIETLYFNIMLIELKLFSPATHWWIFRRNFTLILKTRWSFRCRRSWKRNTSWFRWKRGTCPLGQSYIAKSGVTPKSFGNILIKTSERIRHPAWSEKGRLRLLRAELFKIIFIYRNNIVTIK